MKICSVLNRLASTKGRFLQALAMVGFLGTAPAFAQQAFWPLATIEPPSSDVAVPPLAAVALSGQTAVTLYAPADNEDYQVYLRRFIVDAWSPAQLLAGGASGGQPVSIDADGERIVVGIPAASGGGRIDIYRQSADQSVVLEQSLTAPEGVSRFGLSVSIRNQLLVVRAITPAGGGGFHAYRFDATSSTWNAAGQSQNTPWPWEMYLAVTNGTEIATCTSTHCIIRAPSEDGNWTSQATFSGSRAVAFTQNCLFSVDDVGARIHRRSGDTWSLVQTIDEVDEVAATEDTLLTITSAPFGSKTSLWEPDAQSQWMPVYTTDRWFTFGALGDAIALNGEQSFTRGSGEWAPSGVAGRSTLRGALMSAAFGFDLSFAGDGLWITSPGVSANDLESGALWRYDLAATPASALAGPLRPIGPALGLHDGSAMASDGVRLASVSGLGMGQTEPVSRLSIRYAEDSTSPAQEIELPALPNSTASIAVSIDGDTIAVTRWLNGTLAAPEARRQVLVYRDAGNDFDLRQVIELQGNFGDGYGLGYSVVVRGDWLLAGRQQFRRVSDTYVYVADLAVPAGVVLNAGVLSADSDTMVMRVMDPQGPDIAHVFAFDNAAGWSAVAPVTRGAFLAGLGSPCLAGC